VNTGARTHSRAVFPREEAGEETLAHAGSSSRHRGYPGFARATTTAPVKLADGAAFRCVRRLCSVIHCVCVCVCVRVTGWDHGGDGQL